MIKFNRAQVLQRLISSIPANFAQVSHIQNLLASIADEIDIQSQYVEYLERQAQWSTATSIHSVLKHAKFFLYSPKRKRTSFGVVKIENKTSSDITIPIGTAFYDKGTQQDVHIVGIYDDKNVPTELSSDTIVIPAQKPVELIGAVGKYVQTTFNDASGFTPLPSTTLDVIYYTIDSPLVDNNFVYLKIGNTMFRKVDNIYAYKYNDNVFEAQNIDGFEQTRIILYTYLTNYYSDKRITLSYMEVPPVEEQKYIAYSKEALINKGFPSTDIVATYADEADKDKRFTLFYPEESVESIKRNAQLSLYNKNSILTLLDYEAAATKFLLENKGTSSNVVGVKVRNFDSFLPKHQKNKDSRTVYLMAYEYDQTLHASAPDDRAYPNNIPTKLFTDFLDKIKQEVSISSYLRYVPTKFLAVNLDIKIKPNEGKTLTDIVGLQQALRDNFSFQRNKSTLFYSDLLAFIDNYPNVMYANVELSLSEYITMDLSTIYNFKHILPRADIVDYTKNFDVYYYDRTHELLNEKTKEEDRWKKMFHAEYDTTSSSYNVTNAYNSFDYLDKAGQNRLQNTSLPIFLNPNQVVVTGTGINTDREFNANTENIDTASNTPMKLFLSQKVDGAIEPKRFRFDFAVNVIASKNNIIFLDGDIYSVGIGQITIKKIEQ